MNKKDISRNYIENLLENIPLGTKIEIDKYLLKELLFEELKTNEIYRGNIKININDYFNRPCKLIVWTGEFLTKIDLSEISFENVIFEDNIGLMPNNTSYISKNETIGLKNTNAIINFNNYVGKEKEIVGFNFSNCNIKNLKKIKRAINCNFSNCNLSEKDIDINNQEFINCNFTNNNFNNITWEIDDINKLLFFSSFKNTGIHIKLNSPKNNSIVQSRLSQIFKLEKLVGCYFNEKPIKETLLDKSNEQIINNIKKKIYTPKNI